jgi:GT2 family glycosyltransferase
MTVSGDPTLLSVVIVNWNSGPVLAECLQSLIEHPPPRDWEVLIVDNASRDDSVDRALGVLPTALVVRNHDNRGLAAANNQGIGLSRGWALLICNPDVRFTSGAVEAMVDTLARHPRAAFVIPRLCYPDGTLQTSAGDLPTLGEALLGRQLQRRASARSGFWWDGWDHAVEQPIGRGREAAYLVRRAAIDDIGPQDEAFRLDWEGIDWTARARECGWEVWLCPAAEVVHLGGVSVRQAELRWIVSSHRGMYRYFAKRASPWKRPLLASAIGARAAAKLAGAAAGITSYERGHRGRARAH